MKKIITIVALMFAVSAYATETKKACVKNEKTGKEVCKEIKVHKKLEGTKLPEKK